MLYIMLMQLLAIALFGLAGRAESAMTATGACLYLNLISLNRGFTGGQGQKHEYG
jgi:hypothetical protein